MILTLAGPAQAAVVRPHDLERRLVGLTPGRAEEEERVVDGDERRQPLGELGGDRVRQAQVERRPLERAGLLGHRGPISSRPWPTEQAPRCPPASRSRRPWSSTT